MGRTNPSRSATDLSNALRLPGFPEHGLRTLTLVPS